jgi:hypothetical protein
VSAGFGTLVAGRMLRLGSATAAVHWRVKGSQTGASRLRKLLWIKGRFEGRPASSSFVQPFILKKIMESSHRLSAEIRRNPTIEFFNA